MIALLAAAFAGVGDGAAAFDRGELDRAIEAWEAARDGGAQASGVIEYDLGVAYYRKGDLPRAVARFRAAERLRPRDGNVQHDLALARSGLGTVPPPVGAEAAWMRVITPGELGVASVFVTALGSLLLLVTLRRPGSALLAGGLLAGLLALWGLRAEARHPVAVVVDQELVLRDAAAIDADERMTLPPGAEVRVVRTYGAFLLLEDGKGRRGWAPRNAVDLAWAAGSALRG